MLESMAWDGHIGIYLSPRSGYLWGCSGPEGQKDLFEVPHQLRAGIRAEVSWLPVQFPPPLGFLKRLPVRDSSAVLSIMIATSHVWLLETLELGLVWIEKYSKCKITLDFEDSVWKKVKLVLITWSCWSYQLLWLLNILIKSLWVMSEIFKINFTCLPISFDFLM